VAQFSEDLWWWDETTWIATAQIVLPQLPVTEFGQSGRTKGRPQLNETWLHVSLDGPSREDFACSSSCSNPVDSGGRNLTKNVWRGLEMSSKPSKSVSMDGRAVRLLPQARVIERRQEFPHPPKDTCRDPIRRQRLTFAPPVRQKTRGSTPDEDRAFRDVPLYS